MLCDVGAALPGERCYVGAALPGERCYMMWGLLCQARGVM